METDEDNVSFILDASKKSPVVNPSFVLRGWDRKAKVRLDGKLITSDKRIRQGLVRDTNGQLQLVVWILLDSERSLDIEFEKK